MYDNLPPPLRVQIVHIWRDAIGVPKYNPFTYVEPIAQNYYWRAIRDTVAREVGVFNLDNQSSTEFEECQKYLFKSTVEDALSIIEVSFVLIKNISDGSERDPQIKQSYQEAVEELNYRFREHGVGYSFVDGKVIRVDSEYLHVEVVIPAITLLRDARFAGAAEEFLKAHEHYRHRRNKEAIADALKAFESTMRAICDRRKWPYKSGAAAKELIQIILDNGLVPTYLQSEFGALRSLLESGLPTVRNKVGGHGQGAVPVEVPDYLAAYALHLAGSNIRLLVEADRVKN